MKNRLIEMWAALADAYGSAFTNQFGDEPNQTWAEALSRYEIADILAAVGRIIDSGGEYAPNLASLMGQLNQTKAPNQHLMQRTAHEAMNAPIIDKSESANALPNPDAAPNIEFGDYQSLMKLVNGAHEKQTKGTFKMGWREDQIPEFEKIFAMGQQERTAVQYAMDKTTLRQYLNWRWDKLNPELAVDK